MFNFFKKEPKVTWFTPVEYTGLMQVVKPERASKHLPQWLLKTPSFPKVMNPPNAGTIRDCPSTFDFMGKGYVIPMWCDLELDVKEDGGFHWRTPYNKFIVETHTREQYKDYLPESAQKKCLNVAKLISPFMCKTTPGYGMFQYPMYYHFNEMFEILPGIIFTDIHHEMNLQMILKKPGKFTIKQGTPIVQFIPFKREKVTTEYADAIDRPDLIKSITKNDYMLHTKFKKAYKKEQSKCPYHK